MKTRGTITAVAILALMGLLMMITNVGAHPPAGPSNQGTTSVAVDVPPLLQYQGRLTDPASGEPVEDGSYTMAFRLYDVESGGSWLWSETKDVPVEGGVFSTTLGDWEPLNPGLFNGQSLWLGIKVGADAEATPRQRLLPVAYALGLAPGAHISTTSSSPVFTVSNAGAGDAFHVDGATTLNGDLSVTGSLIGASHEHSGADITSGTVAEPRIDGQIARDAELEGAMTTHAGDPGAHHLRYTDAEAWGAVQDNDGAGSGLDADLLDGQDSSAFASDPHDHWGDAWSGSGTGLTLRSTTGYGLRAESTSTAAGNAAVFGSSGTMSNYPGQEEVGVRGEAVDGYGVAGGSSTSAGVYGYSDSSYGVWGTSSGSKTSAVYGYNSSSGHGVLGTSASGFGVVGDGGSDSGDYGGYFTGGAGLYAEGSAGTGVLGVNNAITGFGVRGESGGGYGELGRRSRVTYPFVLTYSYGVYGRGTGATFDYGGFFNGDYIGAYGTGPTGLYGASTDDEGDNRGITTPDNLYVGGKIDVVGTVDPVIGERFEVHPDGEYEVGDLLVIDPDSPYLVLSTAANDTKVIGVVGPSVDYRDGELMVIVLGYHGAKPDESLDADSTRTVARIKVDASQGAIKRGDLLTTSPTPGHAMKAQPVDVGGVEIHRPGTIIGKALESLDSGQGLIEAFIALQ
jgi:hypothetical protein